MSKHKDIYFKAFGYTPGDFIASEVSGAAAVDVHAIIPDSELPGKHGHRIENLIALTRKEHIDYGDKKHFKAWLFKVHLQRLREHGVPFSEEWILNEIERYKDFV
jgi:hypothetical protein